MCYHPRCRECHAPDRRAWGDTGQTSLLKAERARQNRAYVRKLLQERQPEFAAALAAAKEHIVRQRSAPDVTVGHKAEKHGSTGTRVECSETAGFAEGLSSLDVIWHAEILTMQPQPRSRMPGQTGGSERDDTMT
jgi:hypothetical protein